MSMLTYNASHAEHSWSWAVTVGMWMPRGQLVDADPPGLWLLSETPCSIIHITCTKPGLSPEIVLDLKDRPQFLRRTLEPGRFDYFLTCPDHGAATEQMSRGHVMAIAIQDGDHEQTLLALHFHASHGGLECASILQSIQRGMMHVVPFQNQEEAPGKQLVSIEDFLSSAGQKDIAAAILACCRSPGFRDLVDRIYHIWDQIEQHVV